MGDVEITLYIWPTMYTTVYQRKGEKAKIEKTNRLLTVSSYFLGYLPNLQIRIIFDTGKFNFIVASVTSSDSIEEKADFKKNRHRNNFVFHITHHS